MTIDLGNVNNGIPIGSYVGGGEDAYTKAETDNLLDKKQDKLSPQAPIVFTSGDNLLPPVDSFTSNNVEGLYQITASQSYHDGDAYQRFKEEIWDGSAVTYSGGSTTLTYKRLDGNKFPTGKTIIEVPFVTYRYCLGSINFYTLDENGNTLETFSQTYDPVGRDTHINYTLTVNSAQDYSGFKFEWVASDASGFNRQNQNRIGPITIRNSNGIGLNIDDNTIKINSDGKLTANLPIGSSTQKGIVQVDGTTIVSNDGVISATGGGGEIDAYTKAETDELLGEKADKFTTSAPLTISEKSDAEYDGTITNGTISFDGVNSFTTISDVLYAGAHNGDRITRYVALPLDVNTIVKTPIMGNFNNTSEYGQIRAQVLLGDFDNEGKFIPYVGILNERRSNNYYGRMNGGATISNINPNGAYGLSFTYTSPSSHIHAAYNLETATPDDAPIENQSIYIEKYISNTGELMMGLWTVGDVDGSSINNMVSTTFDGSIGTELQEACKKSKWVLISPANNGLTPNIGDFKIYETNGRHGWNKAGLLSGITNAPYKQPLVSSTANIALLVDNSTIKVNDNGQLYAVAQESPAPTNMVTTDTTQEITGSKLFSNGLKVGGYAGISDDNGVVFIKAVPDAPNSLHAWEIGNNDSAQFKDIMIRRDVNGRYINIDSGNISEYLSGAAPSNMVTTDTEQTISGVKTFSAGIKGKGYIENIGLTDLIYTDNNKNPHVGNISRTLTVHTNPTGNGRILINDGSANYEDIHTGNIANFIDGTSITFTNNKLSATSGAAPSNMVTTNTEQNITGTKTFINDMFLPGIIVQDSSGGSAATIAPGSIGVSRLHVGGTGYLTADSTGVILGDTSLQQVVLRGEKVQCYDPNGNKDILHTGNAFKQVKLTQAEYDALTTKDENTMYIIVG